MGRFFANLSYAYQRTNQPTNYADASPRPNNSSKEDILKQGYGLSRVSMLPKDYGRLELGTRWFDQKLTLGMAARYYGKKVNVRQLKKNISMALAMKKYTAGERTYYAGKKQKRLKNNRLF